MLGLPRTKSGQIVGWVYRKDNDEPNGDIYVHYDRDRGGAAEILFARFREEDVKAGKLVSKGAALKILVKSRQFGMNRGGADGATSAEEPR